MELLELMKAAIDAPDSSSWLHGYHPLQAYTHADLNLANILVDVQGTLWLIDFAKSGVTGFFDDAVKVVSVLLFEHFPLPWTLGELVDATTQKLIDAFGIKEEAARRLSSLARSIADDDSLDENEKCATP